MVEQVNQLATGIQQAHSAFYNESSRFASPKQIDDGLRAALYFTRAAAALMVAQSKESGIHNRLQIAASQLGRVKSLMQSQTSLALQGDTAHASSVMTGSAVVGEGDIRSSASFAPAISPGSLATILGNVNVSPLAEQTATATRAADGSLPYELTGISVTIAGKAAPVISISPSQVSFYVPADINTGVIEFIVTSQDGLVSRGSTYVIPATAVPAIFTANGNGTGAGLVLNATTYEQGSFSVTSPSNIGTDKRTRLLIMATGISSGAVNSNTANDLRVGPGTLVNLSESVRVEARTRFGQTFSLPVEFAGAAGTFPGLEQINVALLPELQGAGEVELTIIVGAERSNAARVSIK